jgi:PAS domain-containing protein
MGDKEPLDDSSISHGMCEPCSDHFSRLQDGLSLGEYLDDFPLPVIAVDGDGRVLAANQQMATLLGKEQRDLAGLLGGDVMECAYARLPEGCGKTVHCETCAVRLAVMRTLETGEPQQRVPAFVQRDEGRLDVWISTSPVGRTVRVVIDTSR